jgi:transketolase
MTVIETCSAARQSVVSHADLANAIRALAMDAVEKAASGHPGMPMGMADVATVLFRDVLKFDSSTPDWPDRDRFVLSAGHGSMLLYALLYLTGYKGMTLDELKRFRQLGSLTPGHPEFGHCPGVETTTGPLGQGLANAVGMALAERMLNARFGDGLVDHWTYVIAGDGCLMEGISHEAIDLAGHLRLSRLIVLWDDNRISIDGPTSLATSTDQLRRFEAAGWHTQRIDGHDPKSIATAIAAARTDERPSLIACRTVIGFGAPSKQGTEAVHGAPLGATEIEAARKTLGWPHAPFEIPRSLLAVWRAVGARGATQRAAWEDRVAAAHAQVRRELKEALSGCISSNAAAALDKLKCEWTAQKPKLATRQASKGVLEVLAPHQLNLAGGSADLTHSNLTYVKAQTAVRAGQFAGRYVHYGVREHAMAAAMNGIALHGGLIPYGGTFLAFSDYCRPSIRLAALMRLRVVYVMTHDSIGLGEDGPTHQPVEHLASLRAIPNLCVVRPADAVETLEAWQVALNRTDGPTLLCLTRQAVPAVSGDSRSDNLVRLGAYVLSEPPGRRDLTLMASGSEVGIAMTAARELLALGRRVAVISMPCWELFLAQPRDYQEAVLGSAPRISVEAGVRLGWDRWLGPDGVSIGMTGFGASAPAGELYWHFGITPQAVVDAAESIITQG